MWPDCLEHACASSCQDLGLWIKAVLKAWSLFCFPSPIWPSVLAKSSGKVVFLSWRSKAAVQSPPGKPSQVWTVPQSDQGLRRNPFWMSCALALLFGEAHTAYSLAPNSPGVSRSQARSREPRFPSLRWHRGRQAMSGMAPALVQGAHAA